MPSAHEGPAIASARILREQERRTGTLDLGDLGLTAWPNELWELIHLSCLNLGVGWTDAVNGFHPASPGIPYAPNALPPAGARELWNRLPNLQTLSLAGARGDGSAWDDLAGLESLPQLRVLDLSWTSVEDLTPLAGLAHLEVLDASYTFVSDIASLTGLTALRHLDLSHTKAGDLSPLARHSALQVLLCYHTPITTVAPLHGLPALRKLDLTQTRITDLEPLVSLPALETLLYAWTPVETIPESLVRLASSAPHPPTGQTPPP